MKISTNSPQKYKASQISWLLTLPVPILDNERTTKKCENKIKFNFHFETTL